MNKANHSSQVRSTNRSMLLGAVLFVGVVYGAFRIFIFVLTVVSS